MLESWGWRLPFIGGLIFAAAGYLLRRDVSETPEFEKAKQEKPHEVSTLRETLRTARSEILTAIGVFIIHPASVHLLFIYFPIYMKTQLGYTYTEALFSNFAALSISMMLMPVGGWLSDRIGRRPLFLFGSVSLCLFAYPAFELMAQGNYPLAVFMQMLLAIFFSLMHGPYPAFLTELFPTRIRYTASAIAYNVCVGIFGGLSPLIATWLIAFYETPVAPAFWLVFCGMLSTISILSIKDDKVLAV